MTVLAKKPSGSAVVGDIPSHWEVKPIRALGRILKGVGGSKEDVVEEGIPCVRYGDLYTTHGEVIEAARTYLTEERAAAYTPIYYGDILFAASGEKLEEIGKSAVNLIRGEARCGGDMIVLRPSAPVEPRFLGYAANASPAVAQKTMMGRGTTVKHIYPGELRNLTIPLPPLDEQVRIANLLERKTVSIDRLIAKQEQLLTLLAEKRQGLITQAVTKGLDPNAPTKDSGIDWLGPYPQHWAKVRVSYVADVRNGSTPDRNRSDYWDEGTIPWLSSGKVNDFIVTDADQFITDRALHENSVRILRKGTVLVGLVGQGRTRGMSAIMALDACINQNIAGITARSGIADHFLHLLFVAAYESLRALGRGGQQDALNCEIIKAFSIPIPPLEEQERIVAHVRRELRRLDGLTQRAEAMVEKLREYRQALITAAVTGKLDTGAAVPTARENGQHAEVA